MRKTLSNLMRKRPSDGFTLLEVMLATVLLAVGSMGVIMVLTAASAFAAKRQLSSRLTQVLDEARFDAQTQINLFVVSPKRRLPGDENGAVDFKPSRIYNGFEYKLEFKFANEVSADQGFETAITVRYGAGQEYADFVVIAADTIPDAEFASSTTYEEERKGKETEGTRENR